LIALKESQNQFRNLSPFPNPFGGLPLTSSLTAKALELFMISLVTKAAAEAKSRSSKRVSAVHLKQAVTKDEQFDFLSEIVSKVAEAPAAAEKSEDNAMEVEGKKRKGGGRKKRKADDDDF